MPYSKSTEVLYYNADFFAEHGLSVPTTWDEMEDLCARILEIDPTCIPLGYDSEGNWFITMCEQYGSPYTSAEAGKNFLFDNETNRNFVKMFHEWYKAGYITTSTLYGGYTSGLFTATDGTRSYMSIGSSAGATHQAPAKGDDGQYPFSVGIATIPQVNPDAPKAISQGPSLCIFKKSNEAEVRASWLFVKFLTTNLNFQAEFGMTSGYIPVLENVTDNAVYADELAAANGYEGLPLLATKVALEQANAYYTSPAFNGSSAARDQVGALMQKCMSKPEAATADGIKKMFEDAVKECNHQIGK